MAEKGLTVDRVLAFAAAIREIREDPNHHPETSLYGPLEQLLRAVVPELRSGARVIAQHNTRQKGVPDFALLDRYGHPFAYIEAKQPDTNLENLKGADREQLARYRELPCVLYTNFSKLVLYVEGEEPVMASLVDERSLDPETRRAPSAPDLDGARDVFERLATFAPSPLRDAASVAAALARRARVVRAVVEDVIAEEGANPLRDIYAEFEEVLFAGLSAKQFADAYAETLAYGLLLARVLRPEEDLRLDTAPAAIGPGHKLLSSAVRLLGQPETIERIGWSVQALVETARLVDPARLFRKGKDDPALYFYEDFLGAYDPALRKKVGVYFTPRSVVDYQVRAVEHMLVDQLAVQGGFADDQVTLLDPATGTGTYLLGVLRRAADRTREESGGATVRGTLRSLARRVHGFELLVGPYAVARWRLSTFLTEEKIGETPSVVLTDTLVPPAQGKHITAKFGFLAKALTDERAEADRIKGKQPIMVILGNPPYGRTNLHADDKPDEEGAGRWKWIWSKVDDFKKGVPDSERVNLKNLLDRYVFFWRWAFWKLLEEEAGGAGRGVVSFITNRSFLDGGAFAGMRAYIRANFQRVQIVDLGGDNRAAKLAGAAQDVNVFEIETPVAIAVCVRSGQAQGCEVQYKRIRGTREEKFAALERLNPARGFTTLEGSRGDAFMPKGDATFQQWPTIKDLFATRFSGIETKRDTLVVAVRTDELHRNLNKLRTLHGEDAKAFFHETRDRKLPAASAMVFDHAAVARYGYRPLDRRFIYLDERFVEYARWDSLQPCWGDDNKALITLPRKHGSGPTAFAHAALPDRHAYRGSYGGHVFPLWDHRAKNGRQLTSNIRQKVLDLLGDVYGAVKPEEVFDFLYAVLQAPSYPRRFHDELQQGFPRIPFPESRDLYQRMARRGEQLLSLHCFERLPKRGENPSRVEGEDAVVSNIDFEQAQERVRLGADAFITHVTPEMWAFEVSGYPVLQRWLEGRKGLTLTPDEVKELLAVVFAIRKTVEDGPALDEGLAKILGGPLLDLSSLLSTDDNEFEAEEK